MNKFKIGDKVRVFKKSENSSDFNNMKVILTVNQEYNPYPYCIKPNGRGVCVSEDRLEIVKNTLTIEIDMVSDIDELKILREKVNKAAVKLDKTINEMNEFKLKLK